MKTEIIGTNGQDINLLGVIVFTKTKVYVFEMRRAKLDKKWFQGVMLNLQMQSSVWLERRHGLGLK